MQLTCIYVHIYILHYFSHLYPTVHLQAKKIEGYCHHLKFWVKEVPKKVDFRSLSWFLVEILKKRYWLLLYLVLVLAKFLKKFPLICTYFAHYEHPTILHSLYKRNVMRCIRMNNYNYGSQNWSSVHPQFPAKLPQGSF